MTTHSYPKKSEGVPTVPKVLFVNDQSGNALSAAHFDDATDVVEATSTSGAIELLLSLIHI